MNVRRVRLVLWTIASGGTVTTALAASSLWWPLDVAVPSTSPESATLSASPTAGPADPSPQAFEALVSRNLRPPLFDPPPPPQAPRPLPVRLTGLIKEPGRSLAVLQTQTGRTELRAAGETSGEVEVLSVSEESVEVRFNGAVYRLAVEKEPKG